MFSYVCAFNLHVAMLKPQYNFSSSTAELFRSAFYACSVAMQDLYCDWLKIFIGHCPAQNYYFVRHCPAQFKFFVGHWGGESDVKSFIKLMLSIFDINEVRTKAPHLSCTTFCSTAVDWM